VPDIERLEEETEEQKTRGEKECRTSIRNSGESGIKAEGGKIERERTPVRKDTKNLGLGSNDKIVKSKLREGLRTLRIPTEQKFGNRSSW